MIQIKNRYTGAVIFETEIATEFENESGYFKLGVAVKKAVSLKINLRGSDLRGSDLRGSDLSDSNLSGSNLRGSDLSGSDLSGSNLRGSDLSGSDLRCSNLRGSDLSEIKADVFMVMAYAIPEIPALINALKTGMVDGSTYSGECSCLVGTICKTRGIDIQNAVGGIKPNSSRPAERFYLGIKKGDTPETNPISKIALEWAEEFLGLVKP